MVLSVLAPARDVYAQLEAAQAEIAVLKAKLAAQSKPGIAGPHGALTTPRVFADLHRTSVSTVNRALNADELLGVRQPNNRWLVYVDQPWKPKRNRGE